MIDKAILFIFILQGTVFSYSISAYAVGAGQVNIYNYTINATWLGDAFNISMSLNYTFKYLKAPLNATSYKTSSYFMAPTIYDIFYLNPQGGIQYILYFTNYSATTVTLDGKSIPAIKFYNGSTYLIVSAQYGFPIEGYGENYLPFSIKGATANLSINLNKLSPLPSFDSQYSLYYLILNFPHESYDIGIVSPNAKISVTNVTLVKGESVGVINIMANGYATVILPLSGFPNFIEPLGEIIYNSSRYYFYMNFTNNYYGKYYLPIYYNASNPFMGLTIGHYFVLFFPIGGNISIYLNNLYNPIISYKVIEKENTSFSLFLIIGAILSIVIVSVVVIKILKSRKV